MRSTENTVNSGTVGTIGITLYLQDYSDNLKLPVTPDQLELRSGLANNTAEVAGLGEIGLIGNPKLKTITLSSFFPAVYSPYCQVSAGEMMAPYEAVNKINGWMQSRKPIILNISGMRIKLPCMIEEFSYREKGGQPGDVYYDLVLKEFKDIKPRIVSLDNSNGKTRLKVKSSRTDTRKIPSDYTVKSGDTLYVIAKKFFNDGSKWKELYEKNKAVIGKNPNLIKPGQVLKL